MQRAVADLNEIARSDVRVARVPTCPLGQYRDCRALFHPELPLVVVNREEVQQVVLNLLSNAEHAVRAAGPARAASASRREKTAPPRTHRSRGRWGGCAGGGGEPHLRAVLYDEAGIGQGTGLGLSVSLGIAAAHGGSLELIKADQGATFALTLPLAPVTTAQVSNEAVAS